MQKTIQILTDFFWEHCPYLHRENLKEDLEKVIEEHLEYKTIVWLTDETGLIGLCRFNIEDKEAKILDVAIRPDQRNKDILKQLLLMGLQLWPNVKQLRFNDVKQQKEFVTPTSLILKE